MLIKQGTTNDGIRISRSSSSTQFLWLYHDGSATIEANETNLKLKSGTTAVIELRPGGGAGQIRQVAVVPLSTVTSVENNASLLGFNGTFAPTAAGGDFSILCIEGTINQTGSANGIVRGIKVLPVLTAVASEFRAIDIAVDSTSAKGIYQSGSSTTNYMVGKTSLGSTSSPSEMLSVTGNISLTTAGNKLKIATGSNASLGTATLSSGTVTVSTTAVTTSSIIFVCHNTVSGTQGILSVPSASITNGTSFIINSSMVTDNSTVNW